MTQSILSQLENTIKSRQQSDPKNSYVAQLNSKGIDTILKKIGEEATETVIAAKSNDKSALVYESCDLIFHLMVLLSYCDINLSDIESELERRFGLSGITEKQSRNKS